MGDITQLLTRWSQGDTEALAELMPLVYQELRQVAGSYVRQERAGHTLRPTALVHEAYMRLASLREMGFNNRVHFYGAPDDILAADERAWFEQHLPGCPLR